MTADCPSFRGSFWPAERIPCGEAHFSAIFIEGWRLVRLADIQTEQAPTPSGNDIGRLARQFFCLRLLLDGDDYDSEEDEDEHHDAADRQEQNR